MIGDDELYCHHQDENTGYRMELVENGIDTIDESGRLRRGDRYECIQPDCDTVLITDFGQPYDLDGITQAIKLVYDDNPL